MSTQSFRQYLNSFLVEWAVEPEASLGLLTDEEYKRATDKLASLPNVPDHEIFFKNKEKPEVNLKKIGYQDHGRVYHLTDVEKNMARRVEVPLECIGRSQPNCQREGIQRAIDRAREEDIDKSDFIPFIVKEDGVYYVQDGHHRTSAMMLAGRPTMIANVVEKRGDHWYVPKPVKKS